MKIGIVNTTYNNGSTGKLVYNFQQYLSQNNIESMVLFGQGGEEENPNIVRVCSEFGIKLHNFLGRVTGLNGCFSTIATYKAVKEIKEFNPDIIYLGNLHGHYINIYLLYREISKLHIPIVKIMWDEYAMTGACAFSFDCERYKSQCEKCNQKKSYPISYFFDTSTLLQKKKEKAYKNQKICFVSVPYIISQARHSSLLKNYRLFELDEAVDQDKLYYPRSAYGLQEEIGIAKDKIIILNVCPYPDKRKGGEYYLQLAKKLEKNKDFIFVHVGFMGDKSECPSNYIPIGYERDQNKMALYYSMADLFVCTSLAETQPNTCIEALSCGTPICGFDISGIPTCAEMPYGRFVEARNVDALVDVVIQTKKKTEETIEATCEYAQTRFSSNDYNRKLLEIGEELLRSTSSHV